MSKEQSLQFDERMGKAVPEPEGMITKTYPPATHHSASPLTAISSPLEVSEMIDNE